MRFKHLKCVIGAFAMTIASHAALAANPIKFGLCYDLTEIYVAAVPQLAQAVKDYADVLNASRS